jgi:hypothetical protein
MFFWPLRNSKTRGFISYLWAPKFEKSLLRVSEISLVILDDIEDLMNPHKITPDWYGQSEGKMGRQESGIKGYDGL